MAAICVSPAGPKVPRDASPRGPQASNPNPTPRMQIDGGDGEPPQPSHGLPSSRPYTPSPLQKNRDQDPVHRIIGMDRSTAKPKRPASPDQRAGDKAHKTGAFLPPMGKILGENTPMDTLALAIDLPALAAAIGGQLRSVRNAFYSRPQDFPPAVYLPGCRGPRFLVEDVQTWLESRRTQQAAPQPPAAPKRQGRPRQASVAQIARARQGQGGAA